MNTKIYQFVCSNTIEAKNVPDNLLDDRTQTQTIMGTQIFHFQKDQSSWYPYTCTPKISISHIPFQQIMNTHKLLGHQIQLT